MQSNITRLVKETAHKMRHPQHDFDKNHTGNSSTTSRSSHRRKSIHTSDPEASGRLRKLFKQKREEMKNGKEDAQLGSRETCINPSENFYNLEPRSAGPANSTLAQVGRGIRMEVYDETVVLDTQIQLYCTNGQLCHPWISPVLGYLGGLPPLYILAGDDEVLRDEIIYWWVTLVGRKLTAALIRLLVLTSILSAMTFATSSLPCMVLRGNTSRQKSIYRSLMVLVTTLPYSV